MRSLLKLKPYIRPYLPLILLSALLALPLSALRVSPVHLVKHFVDDLLVKHDNSKILLLPLIVIGIYLLNFVIRFFHYYLLRIVVVRVNQKLKNDLFQHVLGLSADYFSKSSTGTLISRVGSDPNLVDSALASVAVILREPIVFVLLLGHAFFLNWRLALITLAVFPFLAWVFNFTGRYMKRTISAMQEENASLFSTLQEAFVGIRVIHLFKLKKYVHKKFREKSDRYANLALRTSKVEEASHPMVELLTSFAIAGVIYYGGSQVIEQKMTPGDLLAFFTTFALIMDPIRRMNDINIKLNQAGAACERIFDIFNWKSHLQEPSQPVKLESFTRHIRIEDISFSYPGIAKSTLAGVSFEIPKNQTVALVGESGAGKSSLAGLIPRLYDVSEGRIAIDGIDIKSFSTDTLRSLISVVSQEVFLFNDSIEENIRSGRLSATKDEIIEAAKHANAHHFISKLPEGYKTVIGDRGQRLSGGERQRISIARAFLRAAPILILDEATSNLDNESERMVQQSIEELMKDRTTLVIAHRLSTIRKADTILVMKNGKIVERGTHDDLIKAKGEYLRLYQSGEVLTLS